ncbi:unnamed protein product, partial [Candidula unifasciata]
LLSTGWLFSDPDLVSFVQLVVDEDREQLLNACRNFVRVLILTNENDEVFTCGTNAFTPVCTWRNVSHLAQVTNSVDGRGMCPFSPDYNATALMTSDGFLYAATVIDFSARDPVITRRLAPVGLRTMQHDSKWLNEPNFVSAYEINNFVYFFFRETAVEYINCGKRIYSRMARVCKNDKGGSFSLQHIWTSYHKARLNCSLPGNFPFYFDELHGTFYSEDEELIYAVFSTPQNSIAGSAVCVYNMTALTDSFDGPFKFQEGPSAAWQMNENNFCESQNSNSKRSSEQSTDFLMAAKKYQLMDRAVQSRETGPLIMRENERWTHIVVDHVPTKLHLQDVLFLATEDGKLRKMLRLPGTDKTCLIEEIKIVSNGRPRPVTNMRLSSRKGAIYITTEGDILKVQVERCNRFTTAMLCLNAQDPYCGWDSHTQSCSPAPGGNVHSQYWEQDIRHCPILDSPIDGGWSDWSQWSVCRQVGHDRLVEQCLCRLRSCDHPRPANRGWECRGPSMEISNCTVHGGWTEWSAWSACSQTCGFAMRQRTRQCGNPAPKFGGDTCTGSDKEEAYCSDSPECPMVPVDGDWSGWSGWSTCTANCNSGIQTRKRSCDRPPPIRGGIFCMGNREEWRMCNTQKCPELSKTSPWTEWVQTNRTSAGYLQQRFRFTCRANVETSKDIKTTFAKSQAKFCFNDQKGCYKPKELSNSLTSIDTFSSMDTVLKNYCKQRRRLFKNYCSCRTLGVFLVCQKCGFG